MKNRAYFDAIEKEMDNGGREALLYFLLNYDLNGIDLGHFPQTAALLEQKIQGMTAIQKFWYSKLEYGSLLETTSVWNVEVPIKDLYKEFIEFANNIGVRHKASDSEFGAQIKKLIPGLVVAKGSSGKVTSYRPNVYRLPELRLCREAFEKLMKYDIEWPEYKD